MKKFRKLGFNSEETVVIVNSLNNLLANYQIHYQKLRNFHWNVEGDMFFELHEEFEKEYNEVKVFIDEIAERIRVFGKRPVSTLRQYLSLSDIEECNSNFPSQNMVGEIINDKNILISLLVECYENAANIGDISTTDMLAKFLKRTENKHWMFSAFNKQVDQVESLSMASLSN